MGATTTAERLDDVDIFVNTEIKYMNALGEALYTEMLNSFRLSSIGVSRTIEQHGNTSDCQRCMAVL